MEKRDKPSQIEVDLLAFRDEKFSHNSAEEFLNFQGESPKDYMPVHLSAAYVQAQNEDQRLYETELKLAKQARDKGCSYVTNIDYCGPCIAATGLRRK